MISSVVLNNLLSIFTGICVAMSLVAWLISRSYQNRLSKLIFCFWFCHCFSMVLTKLTENSENPIVWALTLSAWPMIYYFQWKILAEYEPQMQGPSALPILVMGVFGSLSLSLVSDNFILVTSPICFSVSLFGFFMGWEYWKCIRTKEVKTLEIILLILVLSFAVHSIDYPFLRNHPEYAIFGYSYFLVNIVGFAATLPPLSIKISSDQERRVLEKLVQERTEQLLHQSKLSALGEMAAGVAHEINNPLAIIIGRAEQLNKKVQRQDVDLDYLKQSLCLIENTAFRISRIVKALMDFSKQGNNTPFTSEPLEKMMEEIKILCEERFRHKGVTLHMEGNFNVNVRTRGPQISQVILNLLNNAFDAVEKHESPWVKVVSEPNAKFTKISVVDSGKGIPPAIKDKIMHPFFTSKEVGKGVGLGLAISKGIVENHGGRIYLHDNSEHTTFVIELPGEEEVIPT